MQESRAGKRISFLTGQKGQPGLDQVSIWRGGHKETEDCGLVWKAKWKKAELTNSILFSLKKIQGNQ